MISRIRRLGLLVALLTITSLVTMISEARSGYVLSDNITSTTNYGTSAATGSTWLATEFGTDSSAYTLSQVVLLLQNSVAGVAEVDLYSDKGMVPGTLLGTLTSPSSYTSTSLSSTTFTTSGIALAANTNYWIVLKATSGEFDWGYTLSDSGAGTGFKDTWGESDDAGTTWFAYNSEPNQMIVYANPASVPEPSSLALVGAGIAMIFGSRSLRRRTRNALPA